jgi:hypothetical protein
MAAESIGAASALNCVASNWQDKKTQRAVGVVQSQSRNHSSGDVGRCPLSAVASEIRRLLFRCGIETGHQTVRFRWNRFGPRVDRCEGQNSGIRYGTRRSRLCGWKPANAAILERSACQKSDREQHVGAGATRHFGQSVTRSGPSQLGRQGEDQLCGMPSWRNCAAIRSRVRGEKTMASL